MVLLGFYELYKDVIDMIDIKWYVPKKLTIADTSSLFCILHYFSLSLVLLMFFLNIGWPTNGFYDH